MEFVTLFINEIEMKSHIFHPLYNIEKKEELNKIQHLDEFSYSQMVGEEIDLKEKKGEHEATLRLLEKLQKEEDEEKKEKKSLQAGENQEE